MIEITLKIYKCYIYVSTHKCKVGVKVIDQLYCAECGVVRESSFHMTRVGGGDEDIKTGSLKF